MLFSEPKIPQYIVDGEGQKTFRVSVLFSEPKIPQYNCVRSRVLGSGRFSALQRAENSSILRSATARRGCDRFSALQRAENSSIAPDTAALRAVKRVSVLFSEPKIPQSDGDVSRRDVLEVSVLFSEPKIPQCSFLTSTRSQSHPFQCSSASRKFLNDAAEEQADFCEEVSVLFSEPKIPQWRFRDVNDARRFRFSALQRAENSSILSSPSATLLLTSFSALQRAENSSMCRYPRQIEIVAILFQCSSASRKFLNFSKRGDGG